MHGAERPDGVVSRHAQGGAAVRSLVQTFEPSLGPRGIGQGTTRASRVSDVTTRRLFDRCNATFSLRRTRSASRWMRRALARALVDGSQRATRTTDASQSNSRRRHASSRRRDDARCTTSRTASRDDARARPRDDDAGGDDLVRASAFDDLREKDASRRRQRGRRASKRTRDAAKRAERGARRVRGARAGDARYREDVEEDGWFD